MRLHRFRAIGSAFAAVVLAGSLSACSGDDGDDPAGADPSASPSGSADGSGGDTDESPTDASSTEFCNAVTSAQESILDDLRSGEAPTPAELYDAFQGQVDQLERAGTPADIPPEAREGYEAYLDQLGRVSEDDFSSNLGSGGDEPLGELSADDEQRVDDFNEYAEENCGEAASDLEDQLGDIEGDLGDLRDQLGELGDPSGG